jgi:hypothetical protein
MPGSVKLFAAKADGAPQELPSLPNGGDVRPGKHEWP